MKNRKRARRTWPLQRQIDFGEGYWCPVCLALSDGPEDHGPHYLLDLRVDPAFFDLILQACPDKQETPGAGTPKVSTNRARSNRGNGGCSAECA